MRFLNFLKIFCVTFVYLFVITFNNSAVAVDDVCSVTAPNANPFANAAVSLPSSYQGPAFELSYKYPKVVGSYQYPWIKALKGKPISQDNAIAYVEAVKDYIGEDMRTLILNYERWDAATAGWYNLPWLCSIRDPIHGTYVGSSFDPSMFPLSGLKKPMTTHVLVYYNDIAGYTLGKMWGDTAKNPDLSNSQFQEGAIIIKVAVTTALPEDWSPLEGAAKWELYAPLDNQNWKNATFFDTSVFQFDIIVKDTKTAPKTGWVFATLTYDKEAPGDAWDRLVPLGAMWGNDPDINSAINPNAILRENSINAIALLYATETLGYGGRLSGPNDGAVVQNAQVAGNPDQTLARARVSSCLSCHGVAEWPMKSFLLPGFIDQNSNLEIYTPGSTDFNNWFQDRPGNVPQDPGTIALDYDMNIAFKALPLWNKWYQANKTKQPLLATPTLLQSAPNPVEVVPVYLRDLLLNPENTGYNGLPINKKK
ncbi:MAG TPA: hypothetical protein VK184_07125 [Nostocaceae cyanobacterium]|nr:hypothetical protein [Nostocaceae cyanobacterium]